MASASNSRSVPKHQVFINFRGEDVRSTFLSHLAGALRKANINCLVDENAEKGNHFTYLLTQIEKSRIALVIFSPKYTESKWCLKELAKIKERMDENKIKTIPIFYKVEPTTVRNRTEKFGDELRKKGRELIIVDEMKKWEEALKYISEVLGYKIDGQRSEREQIDKIVEGVLEKLYTIPPNVSTSEPDYPSENTRKGGESEDYFGCKQRLEELKEMVHTSKASIVGVVGMHGIGKSILVKELYKTQKHEFSSRVLLDEISNKEKSGITLSDLPGMILKKLLKHSGYRGEQRYELCKEKLLEQKVFIVLDGVNSKQQIQVLLEGHRDWTMAGSKIVIATSDKSLLEGLDQDTEIYVVPQLNHRDGLNHFRQHAFGSTNMNHGHKDFEEISKQFMPYARGNPRILELFGGQVCGKPMAYWEEILKTLAKDPAPSIRTHILKVTYDELSSQEEKEAFQDIAHFRSRDLIYVKSILDSGSGETDIIKALGDKFLIDTSDSSRVEMHNLMYNYATEIGTKANGEGRHQCSINDVLPKGGGNRNVQVKGIFLDLSDIDKKKTIRKEHFKQMSGLRYLKFYSSHCPQECNPDQMIHIPEKLDFPLEEVRYLHWLKYPLEELPPNFNPKNLVDLKLSYSMIERVWDDTKDAPKLKWVDLNHSSKLKTLSGLGKARNLETLNLEGCTALKTLDPDMKNLESLGVLNLKGCTALEAFPDIELVSVKELILSNCSSLKSFLVISEVLETLFLDGTSMTELPTNMEKLTRLVKLNLQDCKKLVKLFEGFHKLGDLQELVCSGCSTLSTLPEHMENMTCLKILLLDGTAITKIPQISSLERLSLSGNNEISLLGDMTQLFQLKWLDLKYCKNLRSIPELPPNLLCLDAHGCESLKTVANPLATHSLVEQIHSTFIFTNCGKLDRAAKEEITSYAQRKCQFLSDALKCCNESFVPEALFSTCFPGCEVPSWFFHEAPGTELELKLPPHWNGNTFVGMALCAIVSPPDHQEPFDSFSVTCTFNLKSKDGSVISFDRLVGSWSNLDKMNSDLVFICYTRCSNNIKCLGGQQSGKCAPTTASFKFGVTDKGARLEVLKCGVRLVYATDKPQKTNSDVRSRRDNNAGDGLETSEIHQDNDLQSSSSYATAVWSGNSSESGEENCNGLDKAQSCTESQVSVEA